MTSLTGKTPGATYKDLLQVSNSNSGIDTTVRPIEDGEGTEGPIEISTTICRVKNTATLSAETVSGSNAAIFDFSQGIIYKRLTEVTATNPYAVLATDYIVAMNLGTPATSTVTLPAATGTGREIIIKDYAGNSDTYTITIDANGAETIDGSTTQTLTSRYASLTLIDAKTGEWTIV